MNKLHTLSRYYLLVLPPIWARTMLVLRRLDGWLMQTHLPAMVNSWADWLVRSPLALFGHILLVGVVSLTL